MSTAFAGSSEEKGETSLGSQAPRRSAGSRWRDLVRLLVLCLVSWQFYNKLFKSGLADSSETVKWSACEGVDARTSSLECARIDVPLSYREGDARTISLPLARIPARRLEVTHRSRKAGGGPPIFLNPGGPGASGVRMMYSSDVMHTWRSFNGTRDILSFDPRGVNGSRPAMSCYASGDARRRAQQESGGLFLSARDSFARALGANEVRGLGCSVYGAELGEFMSTHYVAEDMRYMAERVYRDHYIAAGDAATAHGPLKLDYWGFSYGTVLGMTFAKMFPEQVGSFVLDGVVDLEGYYAGRWDGSLDDTDAVIRHFYESCALLPHNCALARDDDGARRSADEIEALVAGLLERVKAAPLVGWNGRQGELVTYTSLKSTVFRAFYTPEKWPALARQLAGLLAGNTTAFYDEFAKGAGMQLGANEAGTATLCGDSWSADAPVPTTEAHLRNLTELMAGQSAFAADYWATIPTKCQFYPFRPKHLDVSPSAWPTHDAAPGVAADGPYRDILFVGNAYDIVTPYVNAVAMWKRFPGSRLLTMASTYGHCSSAMPSVCGESVIADWLDGRRYVERGGVVRCDVDRGGGAFEWDGEDERRAYFVETASP